MCMVIESIHIHATLIFRMRMMILNTKVSRQHKSSFRSHLTGYMFISPWLIGLLVFTIGPIIYSLFLSFTQYNLLSPPQWIGIDNYKQIFLTDDLFYKSLWVTFLYVITSVPLKLIFALFIAVLLNRSMRGIGAYRLLFYLPSLVGTSVAVAYMWKNIFDVDGLVNRILGTVGINGPSWLTDPSYSLYSLSLLTAWQFGSAMLIFLAGLKQIPESLYEAASIDGATKLQQFFKITAPMLSSVVFFNLIMQMINSFTQFTQGYIITKGGPLNSTLFYSLYLYKRGFQFFQMGYASALAWILLIIIGIFMLVIFKTSKSWVFYESEGE
jgi:multiple sugar transport system permease protein